MYNNILFASKLFSVLAEDWVPLEYKEIIKEKIIPGEITKIKHPITMELNITPNLINQILSRYLLNENGKPTKAPKGLLKEHFYLCFFLEFMDSEIFLKMKRKRNKEEDEDE
jgi:hypothetical protein